MKIVRTAGALLTLSAVTSLSFEAFAQARRPARPADDAAGCAACGVLGGVFIIIPIALIVLNIALLVWVARDAKARGMDSSILWMLLVMFTGFIGLLIYIFARPQGNLVACQHCQGKRMEASAKCPHCGNPGGPALGGYGPPPGGGGYGPPPGGGYGPPPGGGGYGPPPGGGGYGPPPGGGGYGPPPGGGGYV